MKKRTLVHFGISLAVVSMLSYSCKKDNSSTTATANAPTQVLNSDVQDAVADKTDQDVDNTVDAIQANGYSTTGLSLKDDNSVTVTVSGGGDSATFPKTITIIFTNYQDSANGEKFVKNGTIKVVVTAADSTHPYLVTRTHTFTNFSITTDSVACTINGTRTVHRTAATLKFNGLKSIRASVTDSITAKLNYKIADVSSTDSLTFTRIVAKQRVAIVNYTNIGGSLRKTAIFKNILSNDTVTYTGTITGTNEKGLAYTKTVTTALPLDVTFYQGAPVISSGTMMYTVTSAGDTTTTYKLVFSESTANPHKTSVTVTNETTLKTYTYVRKLARKFVAKY